MPCQSGSLNKKINVMKNKKLEEILKINAEEEKYSPYNFCNRFCERCFDEKQARCQIYQDEFEQLITCLAYGKDPDDAEFIAKIIEKQMEDDADDFEEPEGFEGAGGLTEIDLDASDVPGFQSVKDQIKFVENNPLDKTAKQYQIKCDELLNRCFLNIDQLPLELKNDFKTLSWYHTLIPIKIHRALCGFHEPVTEGESALYDSIAQFEICKKGLKESVAAIKNIQPHFSNNAQSSITGLLTLAGNLIDRINVLEQNI